MTQLFPLHLKRLILSVTHTVASTHRSEYHVERHRDVEAWRHVVDHADAEVCQHEVHPLPGDGGQGYCWVNSRKGILLSNAMSN